MRSDLVFSAMTHVPNRYLLATVLAHATRKLHRPGSRIQDTTNEALARFSSANPIADKNAVRVSATVSSRRSRQQPVIPRQAKSIIVPALHENPQAPSEALRVPAAWAS